jgi:hypothetical protein
VEVDVDWRSNGELGCGRGVAFVVAADALRCLPDQAMLHATGFALDIGCFGIDIGIGKF